MVPAVIKARTWRGRSPVRGCMVIKPWRYALWENVMQAMERHVHGHGVKNGLISPFHPPGASICRRRPTTVEGFAQGMRGW